MAIGRTQRDTGRGDFGRAGRGAGQAGDVAAGADKYRALGAVEGGGR